MLADCRPQALFVADPFVEATAGILDPVAATVRVTLGAALDGWPSYDGFLARGGATRRRPPAAARSPVLLCYTSGSTGQPKGVVLTQNALFHNAVNSAHMHDLTSADVVLTTLPLFHVGGLNIQTLPALHCGATVVLHPRFDPEQAIDALERDGVTLTVLVPAQLELDRAARRGGRGPTSRGCARSPPDRRSSARPSSAATCSATCRCCRSTARPRPARSPRTSGSATRRGIPARSAGRRCTASCGSPTAPGATSPRARPARSWCAAPT